MHLMVYAPYGRAGVYMLQEYCRRLGIGTTAAEIRDLAASLRALPPDHPLVPLLRNAPDFRDEAALADALLHPQDRPYSVPQLFDFCATPACSSGAGYGRRRTCPSAARWRPPPSAAAEPAAGREQYAAVELFRGTMVRHSAIVFRNDLPGSAQPIRFDRDGWLEYVMPGSITCRSVCRTPSASRSACRPAPRRC